ncbi:MAG: calcium-binding protein, partial [bacterium]
NDVIRTNAGFIIGDSRGFGTTASGGGRDRITALNSFATNPTVVGDSWGETLVRGGGNDSLVVEGTFGGIGDSASNASGADVRGGGNDSIKALSGGLAIGDSASNLGDAAGGGNDKLTVGGTPAADRKIIGDSSAVGTARGGGKDVIRSTGPGGDDFFGDSYATNGNALLSGADSIFLGPGEDTATGDSFSDLGVATGGAPDLIRGGPSNDWLRGDHFASGSTEGGPDRLFGEGGADTLNGEARRDLCDGGLGSPDTQTACEIRLRIP